MPLSDAKVRNAKPQAKPYKLSDGDGMFLLVTPAGGKLWRFKYYYANKEKSLAFGSYPEINLLEARDLRLQARKALARGEDPGQLKREAKRQRLLKAANTFEAIGREWFEHRRHEWNDKYAERLLSRLDTYVYPKIGNRPVMELTAPELLVMARAIEERGIFETAQRIMQTCGQIFLYAIATGRVERNPVPDLRGALKTPVTKHYSYLSASELPDFLNCLDSYQGTRLTKLALKLLLLTFVRTIELRAARWNEFDFDKAEWRIPAERMKMREQHLVPLSSQAVTILQEVKTLTGKGLYVFPNEKNLLKFMSENTMLYAIYRMGYHLRTTGHGFRSTASTILNEHGFAPDVIERQLAHSERNKIRAAYNHAQYLPERRKMMQWWADYIDAAAARKQRRV